MLDSALDELASAGYAGFSLAGVARRAGVHKATLYRRWGTRERLALDAMLESAATSVPIPDEGALRDDLLAWVRSVAANLANPGVGAIVRSVAAEAPRDPGLAAAGQQFWASRFERAGAIYERAVGRGELPASADPHRITEHLLGPLYLRLLVTGDRLDADLEPLVDFVLAGAGARGLDDDAAP